MPGLDESEYSLGDAVFAIPFLKPNVFVAADEAKLTCHKLLEDCLGTLGKEIKESGGKGEINITSLVTRVYLQDKSAFRKCVLDSDMAEEVKRYYRKKWLPKRVWVMEINILKDYGDLLNDTSVRVGEVLLDPTSEPDDAHFLAIHLGRDLIGNINDSKGIVIDRNPFNGDISGFPVKGGSYSPLIRI